MDCAEEIAAIRRELVPLVGDDRLEFDLLNMAMTVGPGPEEMTAEKVVAAVARAGLKAEAWRDASAEPPSQDAWGRYARTVLTVVSGLAAVAGFVTHALLAGGLKAALGSEGLGVEQTVPLPAKALYALGVMAGVWLVLPKAAFSLRKLRPDMNLLMTIAVLGAIGIGEWFEAATVSFLFAVSLALESWSLGRARAAVKALMSLAPPTVRVLRDGGLEEDVPPEKVALGSRFVARPGERFALDGRVLDGASEVNEAPITGESVPIAKKLGDSIFAGTINGDGALTVESTKPASDTALAKIVKMVGEAQSRRSTSERWVETFAHYYTPAILALALVLLLGPPLLFGKPWADWIYRSLVLLVVGCPCALVISTPVSIVAGLAAAARNGVLVKGGAYLEAPARLEAVAMDKTGTITTGKPSVVEVVPMSGHDERELLEIAVSIEARSEHPLARALVSYATSRGVTPVPAEGVQIMQGKGATGSFGGRSYWLGSHRLLEERKQEEPAVHEKLTALAATGRTVIVVGDEGHVCGFIALADTVRPGAVAAIRALREAGVKHVVMLTGDNEGTARAIAGEVGVDEVRAELLPEDKVKAVELLVAKYGRVAMVGDGVNDAPAMACSTLGIAMGVAGSGAAIETADVALMSDDLSRIPWLVAHSRRTLAIIRQNVAIALVVKGVFVALTLAGHASLWAAIAADMGASLLVIFNGLRLLGVSGGVKSGPIAALTPSPAPSTIRPLDSTR
jgi:Cd2+/Zn2+-exporting ATPase